MSKKRGKSKKNRFGFVLSNNKLNNKNQKKIISES